MSNEQLQGRWNVIRYLSGDEMVGPQRMGSEPAHLMVDGDRVAGTMGVNRLIGEVGVDGLAGPLATTMMAGPPQLMEQETTLLRLLHEADSLEVEGESLTFSRKGAVVLELERQSHGEDLVDRMQGSWIVSRYFSDEEMVEPAAVGRQAGLTIDGDRVAGTMGVNQITGQLGAGGMPVGPLATTRMAGPPAAMEQEAALLQHLHDTDSVEVDETGMSWAKDGLKLVEFSRSGTNAPRDTSH